MTICSLIVQTRPESIPPVSRSLQEMDGVEIHHSDSNGKLIVTIDHPDRDHCSHTMAEMTHIDSVMSTSLVYEYQEDLEEAADA